MVEAFRHTSSVRWVVGIGLVLALGLIAVGAVITHADPSSAPGRETTVAQAGAPSGSTATVSRGVNERAAERGSSFAKSLSEAFHRAAEKVLPSVVTITNSPATQERSARPK
jgi:hypothetical protein